MMKIGPMKWPPPVFLKKRGTDLLISAVNQIANEKELEAARLSVPAFSERLILPFLEVSKNPSHLYLNGRGAGNG
jgi:hypothetical protein